ncbi:hypothetical protein [Leisingera sp. JC11]|uniref:hypothetical protein n=1 Tax=Leisingera sp. JC11 TaxID=3042469 RepID=UPI0034565095
MSRWLALAEPDGQSQDQNPTTSQNRTKTGHEDNGDTNSQPKSAFRPVLSGCQVEVTKPAEVGQTEARAEPTSQAYGNESTFPYGKSHGGGIMAWSGKVVSLEEWRNLSEWDRHGSIGKMWNGIARAWEDAD